jgi:hypothetical protein
VLPPLVAEESRSRRKEQEEVQKEHLPPEVALECRVITKHYWYSTFGLKDVWIVDDIVEALPRLYIIL